MTAAVLYQWPASAHFGRVVPKTKFYEHGKLAAAVRDKFVAEVKRITWAYKLADATIHLRGDDTVPEIEVFFIDAKADDVSATVLAAIDKSVQFPVIFEISKGDGNDSHTRMVATHKQVGGTKPRISGYFSSVWLPSDTVRGPLPLAIDLSRLYAALLEPLLPVAVSPGERLADTTARIDQVTKIEREIAALERRLRIEPQFNRKVELRSQLRERSAALAALTNRPKTEVQVELGKGAPWTS